MKQTSLGLGQSSKRTRRRVFLEEMDRVVPWSELVALISPYMPEGRRGRPPFAVEVMLRIHFMQQWFNLSDPAMEEALHDMALFRDFAGLGGWDERVPDETTILRFRRVLEKHKLAPKILQTINDLLRSKGLMLRAGTVVDATLIAAPSSTKNTEGERDPEMKQSKKGKQWYFGMKAHIGVDADSGLVHTVTTTPANEADVEQVADLLHGEETVVHGDAGYAGAEDRVERADITGKIARKRGQVKAMPEGVAKRRVEKSEHKKASLRARVEHPFRVIKRQFDHVKVRYRGLAKNTAQLHTLFALSNLWMARRCLLGTG